VSQTPASSLGETQSHNSLPGINFAARDWRDYTLQDKAKIPAGYTYFAQLIGHDMGNSVPLSHIPHVRDRQGVQRSDDQTWAASRYNLIENPLTLETIYGLGPAMTPHLYDPKTYKFRVETKVVMSLPHTAADYSVRALHDPRNRDTTILHRLAVIWMKFHNAVVDQIAPDLEQRVLGDPKAKVLIFAQARAHVLTVWHRLIWNEFLPTFADPEVMAMSPSERSIAAPLDETSLMHGLFRAFHALPRRKYKFSDRTRRLRDFLLPDPDYSETEEMQWRLDWNKFFDPEAEGTKTGICASFSPTLANPKGIHISLLDAQTAQETGAVMLKDPFMQATIARLPDTWAKQLDAEHLAAQFTTKFAAQFGSQVTAEEIETCPIFLVFMIEAQLYGKNGRFGPLGSLFLLRSLEQAMTNVQYSVAGLGDSQVVYPASLLELIETLK
jgi:hypothetical protein